MSGSGKGLGFSPSAYMEPIPLIREIVAAHHRRQPELAIRLGIWLNPQQNLLRIWGQGVELLEITEVPAGRPAGFEPQQLPASADHPPLRLIRTGLAEYRAARERSDGFVRELEEKIAAGRVEVVFPGLEGRSAWEVYSGLFEG